MRIYRMDNWDRRDCNFHIFYSKNFVPEPVHTHDFIEIVYVLDGGAEQEINGTRFTVGRGDLFFINKDSTHAFVPKGHFAYYNICFAPWEIYASPSSENAFSTLQLTVFETMRCGNESGCVKFLGSERDEIEHIFSSIHTEYKNDADFSRAVLESYMSILLVKILRKTISSSGVEDWKGIAEYIDGNLGNDLSLSALSQRYFYNSSYFSRAFKEKFGVSLTEYIGKRRIEHAIRLLRETDMTVDEISVKVGFSSRAAFYRVFARSTGKSPSEYRK